MSQVTKPADVESSADPDKHQSIWHKYVKIAEEWDRQMMKKWETNMNNLLLFAALFTSVVTTFTLDALADLNEDTSTKLLRILVEQSTAGQGIDIPGPDIDPSIVAVTSLWLMSIMSSLAATTWAMLSLEWCAFLGAGIQAEDYEEIAEKRQRRFEAVRSWRMHLIVASIPFFLHVSIFLFLAGLWLRMRGVSSEFGLIVGIPSLVIAVSYVILTLLPLFTKAPFSTSVSETADLFISEFRYLLRLRKLIQAPPIVTWISKSLSSTSSKYLPRLGRVNRWHLRSPLRLAAIMSIYTLEYTHKFLGPYVHIGWTVAEKILRAILPTFQSGGNPFRELDTLFIGHSNQDVGVHQRALFWLMNTPLTQSEAMDVLKELSSLRESRGGAEEPLDHAVVKLLVSSISSILENGRITEDEQPVFDYCAKLLTEEMDRTFRESKYEPMILFRNRSISNGLKEFVDIGTSPPPPQTLEEAYTIYWNNVVRSLWLSPSDEQIQVIIARLEPNARSMEHSLLRRVICGLHAATLTSLKAKKHQSILHFPLPDFSKWSFLDDGTGGNYWSPSERTDLDKELSGFLRNLLTKFYKDAQPAGEKYKSPPITTSSLIVSCIKLLDSPPHKDLPLEFHNALCSFAIIKWRNSPDVFDTEPSVARALIASVKNLSADLRPGIPNRSEKIAIRLRAITHGPKYTTSLQHTPPHNVASLYVGPVRDDPACLSEFIHLTAAVLESVLVKESQPGGPDWLNPIYPKVVRNIVSPSFFTDGLALNHSTSHPDHLLPYLYSHAIALSRGIGGTDPNQLEVLDLLRGFDEKEGIAAIERVLNTNALAIIILRLTLSRRGEKVVTEAGLQPYLDAVARALQPLRGIINKRDVDFRRTRWKAIYLLADIRSVLPRTLAGLEQLETLINEASGAVRTYIDERPDESAPKDWDVKKGGLSLCELGEAVGGLAKRNEAAAEVYSWTQPGNIPNLSLYPQWARPGRTSQAANWLLERLQRFVDDADAPVTVNAGDPTANV